MKTQVDQLVARVALFSAPFTGGATGGDTGGGVASDVWSSADGEHWELVWSEKACCARIGHSVVVFK